MERAGWGLLRACLAGALLAMALPPVVGASEIEEIVVTVRKVEESLKDVPIAITAFSAEDVASAGIDDLSDIAELTTGFSYFSAFGGFLPTPVVRGIAQTDIFGEPNAAVFLDGVYVAGREAQNFAQLDLERIEVVKGPQSTLYGRNAFSGAINYVTRLPQPEFGADTQFEIGNDGKVLARGVLNVPLLGEALAGRIAASYDEWDGSYGNAVAGGPDIGGYRYRNLRAALRWVPSERFEMNLSGYHSDDEIDDSAIVGQQANCEDDVRTGDTDFRLLNYCGELQDLGAQYSSLGLGLGDDEIARVIPATGEERQVTQGSLRVTWNPDFGRFSSLTGYFRTKQQARIDGGFGLGYQVPFVYAGPNDCLLFDVESGLYSCPTPTDASNGGRVVTGQLQVVQPAITEEVSQELRFDSPADRRFRYSIGVYAYDIEFQDAETGLIATAGSLPEELRLGFFAPLTADRVLTVGDAIFREWFGPNGDVDPRVNQWLDTQAWSLFGHIEFEPVERLTLRFEARYTDEEKTLKRLSWGNPDVPGSGLIAAPRELTDSWDLWTGRAQARFNFNDDWQTYFTVGRGVKSGGFDSDVVDILDDPETPEIDPIDGSIVIVSFDEEEMIAYEWGVKGNFADGRAGLAVALFRNAWGDVVVPQVFDFDPERGPAYQFEQPESFNENAGDATVQGFEVDLTVRPVDSLTAVLGVSYTDASWDRAIIATYANFPSFISDDFDPSNDGNVAGKQLLRQPPWQVSLSLKHRLPVFGEWEYYSRADLSWEDSWYVGNENQTAVPDSTNVNLRLGLESPRYTVELWVDNLLEEDAPTGAFRQPFFTNTDDLRGNSLRSTSRSIFPWAIMVSHPELRTYGLTLKGRFGGE